MGFLEALGRSQAITGALGAVENRNVSRQNRAIRGAQLGMQQEQLDIQQTGEVRAQQEFDFKMQKAKREEEWLNSAYNVTTDPRFLEMDEEGQKATLAFGEGQGLWNAEGIGTINSARRAGELIEANEGLFEISSQSVVNKRKAAYDNTLKLLTEEKEKPSPNEKKVTVLERQIPLQAERYRLALDGKIKGLEIIKQRSTAQSEYGKWAVDRGLDPTTPTTQQAYAQFRQSILKPDAAGVVTEKVARDKLVQLKEKRDTLTAAEAQGGTELATAMATFGLLPTDYSKTIDEINNSIDFYQRQIGATSVSRVSSRGATEQGLRDRFVKDSKMKNVTIVRWDEGANGLRVKDKRGRHFIYRYGD